MKDGITVILTGYNRPQNIPLQLQALKSQSVKPDDIWLWYNKGSLDQKVPDGVKSIVCNHNFKFHGRFSAALLAQTKYVAIFDDDTIPGNKWFENCLNTMKTHRGILGSAGVRVNGDKYWPNTKFGGNGISNSSVEEVDLVGHAWFFEREWLKHLWCEEPFSWENGEDIQFSFLCKKYGDINTYVPPHPTHDKSLWGSTNFKLGGDSVAHSVVNMHQHNSIRDDICKHYITHAGKGTVVSRQRDAKKKS